MALTYHNNNSISNITSFPLVPSGSPVLLSTATASGSASIEFNSTYLTSTYQVYKFEFINIHPQTDTAEFQFQASTNGGSSYGVTATTTFFRSQHNEADTATALGYVTAFDLAQSTGFQVLGGDIGADADQAQSGYLYIFAPSNTTYVKHFIGRVNNAHEDNFTIDNYIAGYFNTTSAINAIKFVMSSGNIDVGQIKLYGIGAN